jgi:hypothetical protein
VAFLQQDGSHRCVQQEVVAGHHRPVLVLNHVWSPVTVVQFSY